jgi:hypothetical protein
MTEDKNIADLRQQVLDIFPMGMRIPEFYDDCPERDLKSRFNHRMTELKFACQRVARHDVSPEVNRRMSEAAIRLVNAEIGEDYIPPDCANCLACQRLQAKAQANT